MRYVLYRMPIEPTDMNSPIGMNDVLGIGDYKGPKNAMRHLRPSKIGRCINDSMQTRWLGLYTIDGKLVHKEPVTCE